MGGGSLGGGGGLLADFSGGGLAGFLNWGLLVGLGEVLPPNIDSYFSSMVEGNLHPIFFSALDGIAVRLGGIVGRLACLVGGGRSWWVGGGLKTGMSTSSSCLLLAVLFGRSSFSSRLN